MRQVIDHDYPMPPMITTIRLDESVFLRPTIPERIERLKSDGYLIAVDHFSGNRQFDPLYHLADIIAIPMIGRPQEAIATMLAAVGHVDAKLLVRQVDDAAGFELCVKAGASLFEGDFLKPPDTISVQKMTSSEVSRRKLLKNIEEPNPDIDSLAENIQSDAAISFRLLAYLNSPAFEFSSQIKSIHHAIGVLGWQKLRNWLRVILINDMSQAADASDLHRLSAQRGKFLELVAERHDFWGFDPESLHLLGLFSLLDTMIGLPMDEIVAFLPIENKLKGALCRDANNEYLPLVRLARYVEEARQEDTEAMIQQLNLDREKVNTAFEDAVKWVEQLSSD